MDNSYDYSCEYDEQQDENKSMGKSSGCLVAFLALVFLNFIRYLTVTSSVAAWVAFTLIVLLPFILFITERGKSHQNKNKKDESVDIVDGNFLPMTALFHFEVEHSSVNVRAQAYSKITNGGSILGYCENSHNKQVFRLSDIRDCIDLETGEKISDLRAYCENRLSQAKC